MFDYWRGDYRNCVDLSKFVLDLLNVLTSDLFQILNNLLLLDFLAPLSLLFINISKYVVLIVVLIALWRLFSKEPGHLIRNGRLARYKQTLRRLILHFLELLLTGAKQLLLPEGLLDLLHVVIVDVIDLLVEGVRVNKFMLLICLI